jgi:hypothetical protein
MLLQQQQQLRQLSAGASMLLTCACLCDGAARAACFRNVLTHSC